MSIQPIAPGLTFTKWLTQFRGEQTALGDLARRVRADTEWEDPRSLAALESALLGAGRSQAEVQVARRAWHRFRGDRPA
ncbi:MAG TPA: hypothetical protein VMD08_05010 [Candidatus Baltobacteraceae bacterium]|nr:hypothetical protein [Candidatus Baltobacteraceae bacterium]